MSSSSATATKNPFTIEHSPAIQHAITNHGMKYSIDELQSKKRTREANMQEELKSVKKISLNELVEQAPVTTPDTRTTNNAPAFSTTDSALLNFFNALRRSTARVDIETFLDAAWKENPEFALELIGNARDCRGGKGERLVSFYSLIWLRKNKPNTYLLNLLEYVSLGYFKDLLQLSSMILDEKLPALGEKDLIELEIFAEFIKHDNEIVLQKEKNLVPDTEAKLSEMQIDANKQDGTKKKQSKITISLAGKWAPSENHSFDRKHKLAARMIKLVAPDSKAPEKTYRQILSRLRKYLNVVERSLSLQEYEKIQFATVPSKAHLILKKAFVKHQGERYAQYLADLKAGKTTIKSTGIQPHELVIASKKEVNETVESQWNDLVCRIKESGQLKECIAVCDVSGSMGGGGKGVSPMYVCVALGLIIAEITQEPWNGRILTFDSVPQWFKIAGSTLHERVRSIMSAPWGGSTNMEATFNLILDVAVENALPQSALPKTLFLFSDMQFNQAVEQTNGVLTIFQQAKENFKAKGYTIPQVVFWDLSQGSTNTPVQKDETGTALVSGFSTELLKSMMSGEFASPYATMLQIIAPYSNRFVVEEKER